MKFVDALTDKIDETQRKYPALAFIHAVIKRYSDDKTGYHAALLTYYGFLALFPLLLIATTVAGIVATKTSHVKETVTNSIASYFPVLGDQLTQHVTTSHRSGLPLLVGTLIALYGARGVADVFQRGIRAIWHEDIDDDQGFPNDLLKNLGIILVGGFGLLSAAVLAGYAAAAGHGLPFRLLSLAVNLSILFALFTYLLNAALPHHIPLKQIRAGAATAAIGLVLLQSLGGYVLTRELRNLDAISSYFAVSLGLLFWIFLQAQVFYYATTVSVVSANKLWPRGLTDKNPTLADKKVIAQQ